MTVFDRIAPGGGEGLLVSLRAAAGNAARPFTLTGFVGRDAARPFTLSSSSGRVGRSHVALQGSSLDGHLRLLSRGHG